MPGPNVLDARDLVDWKNIELLFMDKTCSILRQPTDETIGLQRGAPATIASNVPCSVAVPKLEDNPFTTPAPNMRGGAQKKTYRLITVPVGTNVKEEDIIAVGAQMYDVDQLAIDESFPSIILINAGLSEGDETDAESD